MVQVKLNVLKTQIRVFLDKSEYRKSAELLTEAASKLEELEELLKEAEYLISATEHRPDLVMQHDFKIRKVRWLAACQSLRMTPIPPPQESEDDDE